MRIERKGPIPPVPPPPPPQKAEKMHLCLITDAETHIKSWNHNLMIFSEKSSFTQWYCIKCNQTFTYIGDAKPPKDQIDD